MTDRGRPVALLVPVSSDPWTDLLATGRVTPPVDGSDVLDEPAGDYGVDASAVLAELREQET